MWEFSQQIHLIITLKHFFGTSSVRQKDVTEEMKNDLEITLVNLENLQEQ